MRFPLSPQRCDGTRRLGQCLPDSVLADGIVSCTDTDTDSDGFDDGSDRVSVTVRPGAVVNAGADDAIVIDGDHTSLTNKGTSARATRRSAAGRSSPSIASVPSRLATTALIPRGRTA